MGALLSMMLVVFGLVYLTGYYLGLRWSLRAKIWMPYRTFLVVNLWISAMILSNVYFFLTVGAVLRPSVCLPSAVGLASVTMHAVLASRRIGQLKAALPSESSRAAATSAAANAALEALEEGLQDWYRRRAVRDAAATLGPLRLLELSGDALRKATHTEIGYGCLVLFLSGPITIAHQAYGYYMGVTEAVVAALAIAAIGAGMQLARPLADGGLAGQQARWEAAVSRAAAEEEAAVAAVRAPGTRLVLLTCCRHRLSMPVVRCRAALLC